MWPMAIEQGPISVLDDSEAWNLLSSVALGRLVTSFGGQLEIFPVNFVTENGTVLFRIAVGHDHTADEGWSVILRGTARMLSGADEIHQAEQSGLIPWVPTEKLRFVRVTPSEISARHFRFGPQPQSGNVGS